MKATFKHYITLNNQKYDYSIVKKTKETTFFECKAANIAQEFLNEDIPELLVDLPNLIIAEKEYKTSQSETLRFRVSANDKKRIEEKAIKSGYESVSDYLRNVALS